MEITFQFISIFLNIVFFTTRGKSHPLHQQSRDSIVLDYSTYSSFQPHGTGSYSFGYEIEDPEYHNIQFRDEERQANGTVTGSYGWVQPDGNIIMIRYVADENGYRATVENSAGQIKSYGQPIPPDFQKSTKSSTMLNAAKNLEVYQPQVIQDRHYRPKDQEQENEKQNFKAEINHDFIKQSDKELVDNIKIEPKRMIIFPNII